MARRKAVEDKKEKEVSCTKTVDYIFGLVFLRSDATSSSHHMFTAVDR